MWQIIGKFIPVHSAFNTYWNRITHCQRQMKFTPFIQTHPADPLFYFVASNCLNFMWLFSYPYGILYCFAKLEAPSRTFCVFVCFEKLVQSARFHSFGAVRYGFKAEIGWSLATIFPGLPISTPSPWLLSLRYFGFPDHNRTVCMASFICLSRKAGLGWGSTIFVLVSILI